LDQHQVTALLDAFETGSDDLFAYTLPLTSLLDEAAKELFMSKFYQGLSRKKMFLLQPLTKSLEGVSSDATDVEEAQGTNLSLSGIQSYRISFRTWQKTHKRTLIVSTSLGTR